MQAVLRILLSALLLPAALGASPEAPVSERNLLERERFWPYHVELRQAAAGLAIGARGVLIRVEPKGRARIDFGRDGIFEVPVAATDLVERANRVRSGEIHKQAPNFVLALGPRLVDPGSDAMHGADFEAVRRQRAFLAVFADPAAPDFARLAAALAPANGRAGLMTILFPQGGHSDAKVRDILHALDWKGAFVYAFLSAPYTRSLLAAASPPPAVQLQTPEGRVLFESRWKPETSAALAAAVDRALGAAPSASAE